MDLRAALADLRPRCFAASAGVESFISFSDSSWEINLPLTRSLCVATRCLTSYFTTFSHLRYFLYKYLATLAFLSFNVRSPVHFTWLSKSCRWGSVKLSIFRLVLVLGRTVTCGASLFNRGYSDAAFATGFLRLDRVCFFSFRFFGVCGLKESESSWSEWPS